MGGRVIPLCVLLLERRIARCVFASGVGCLLCSHYCGVLPAVPFFGFVGSCFLGFGLVRVLFGSWLVPVSGFWVLGLCVGRGGRSLVYAPQLGCQQWCWCACGLSGE